MITLTSKEPMYDRNGLGLVYGDVVLAKIWSSEPFFPCQVVGFNGNFVVLIPLGCSTSRKRKSTNVVKVNNYKKWKINY